MGVPRADAETEIQLHGLLGQGVDPGNSSGVWKRDRGWGGQGRERYMKPVTSVGRSRILLGTLGNNVELTSQLSQPRAREPGHQSATTGVFIPGASSSQAE